jgi:PRTRC genetic system protein B
MTLSFYDFGVMLRRDNVEYLVDPRQAAKALAEKMPEETFYTGLLTDDILAVFQRGNQRVVIGYRPPQKTGLWLENADDALRVPMPGLVMVRRSGSGSTPDYRFYAVKQRPTSETKLYYCPLPHVSRDGSCWGTVRVPDAKTLATNNLQPDWDAFLGSRFGSHSVGGKCTSHSDDIRKLYVKLHEAKKKSYPRTELVEIRGKTFGQMLEEVCK